VNSRIIQELLKEARQTAEESVADMADRELRVPTYEIFLTALVSHALAGDDGQKEFASTKTFPKEVARNSTGTTGRILGLRDEGFFDQPKSLAEIRENLAEAGFHYRLEDLGTPLKRLVQRKQLRRSKAGIRGKTIWRYSIY
jgi:hypothetical protein